MAGAAAAKAGWSYAVEFPDAAPRVYGEGPRAFSITVRSEAEWQWFLRADPYSAALGFVHGRFQVHGDLISAVRFKRAGYRPGRRDAMFSALARFAPARFESLFQTRARAARNIRFHYDRSNGFYRQFLDSRMQYSEGYFQDETWSLEEAQIAKLDSICRKLDLQRGERYLDIGCGWGGLALHAAERYGVKATGCTLSRRQFEYAVAQAAQRPPGVRPEFRDIDYRNLEGSFDKISSVGMYEHVGRRRLPGYFAAVARLLPPGGLFFNSGIARPQSVGDDPETLFLQRRVFPGGELPHLSDVLRSAEQVGFETLEAENVRRHYALTCRAWVKRLDESAEACLRHVDAETYRTWLLYLAASALSFEEGHTTVFNLLLRKTQ
jgi:cyclopropane-fatty-acyl-phospholipid synthase